MMWNILEAEWGTVEKSGITKVICGKFEPDNNELITPPSMPMYYVYVLKRAKKAYIGYTENLEQRIKQHKRKENIKLIYYEAFNSKQKATHREKKLKYYGSAWRALKKRISA